MGRINKNIIKKRIEKEKKKEGEEEEDILSFASIKGVCIQSYLVSLCE